MRALTHRSFGADNNERLEFIGDGLVNAVVAELLYSHYPDLDEEVCRDSAQMVSKRVSRRLPSASSLALWCYWAPVSERAAADTERVSWRTLSRHWQGDVSGGWIWHGK